MGKKRKTDLGLGVMVTASTVHAVLVRSDEKGTDVLRRFTRQRATQAAPGTPAGVQQEVPGLDAQGDDFTIQFGDAAGDGSNLFLNSEFGAGELSGGESAPAAKPFVLELSDILSECCDAEYDAPGVAFCVEAQDIELVEVLVPDAGRKKGISKGDEPDAKRAASNVSRKQLLASLVEQHEGEVETECVAFLPMTATDEGIPRYLALLPASSEPVAPTLHTLQKGRGRPMPRVHFLDTEISLYLGLARTAFQEEMAGGDVADEGEPTTLIVRTGTDDALVLFLRGDRLHHCESLRSLTAYDAPETICSRVLLLQDEYGIGDVQQVLLLNEEQGEELAESFEMFFPDARIASARTLLADTVEEEVLPAPFVAAMGTAFRLVDDERYVHAFDPVNLLPKRLMRRRLELPIAWPSVVLLILLFTTSFFFVWRYFSLQQEIDTYNAKLRSYQSTELQAEPKVLQARIDSLQNTAKGIARALEVMDELLLGSDRWSRATEQIAKQVAAVQGIWVDQWAPQREHIQITGNATARDRVVRLAEQLGADIESLIFSEIREWPVYSFIMRVPLEEELPAVARYLRARAATGELTPEGTPGAGQAPDGGTTRTVPTVPTALDE